MGTAVGCTAIITCFTIIILVTVYPFEPLWSCSCYVSSPKDREDNASPVATCFAGGVIHTAGMYDTTMAVTSFISRHNNRPLQQQAMHSLHLSFLHDVMICTFCVWCLPADAHRCWHSSKDTTASQLAAKLSTYNSWLYTSLSENTYMKTETNKHRRRRRRPTDHARPIGLATYLMCADQTEVLTYCCCCIRYVSYICTTAVG